MPHLSKKLSKLPLITTDYLALLANTPTQAESRLHSLEQGIGLQVYANKTGYLGFKRERAISTVGGMPLK